MDISAPLAGRVGNLRSNDLPPSQRLWPLAALLAGISLAAYRPPFHKGLLEYDEERDVWRNPHVLGGLTGDNFTWAFTSGYQANWHPLTCRWVGPPFDPFL
jgi:hypothetical protein